LIATAPPHLTQRRRWAVAAAAGVTALLLATASLLLRSPHPGPQTPTMLLVRQAAAGHNERQELEIHARSFGDLRGGMKSLDFTLVEPRAVREMSMRLVGARYTTLAGVIAAQIAYIDAAGAPCTLYEARPAGPLAAVVPGVHQVDGVEVEVWREKGLLMLLARPA
jgi:hypothetical protein